MPDVEWLTVREAVHHLGNVSTKLVYKLFHSGELEGVQVWTAVRIRAESVAAYLDAHSNRRKPITSTAVPAPAPTQRLLDRSSAHSWLRIPVIGGGEGTDSPRGS